MAFTEKYVTTTGAGAHTGVDAANAWTLAEALTSAVAGDRVNVQSDSGYSLGADTVTNAGDTTQAIVFRGYNSSIGDLEGQGRNADGTLNTTNFPVITLTGTLVSNAYVVFEALSFTGSINGRLVGDNAIDRVCVIQCSFLNTANNASAGAYQTDDYGWAINSDFECSGASHAEVVDADEDFHIIGCRIKATANTHLSLNKGVVIDTAFFGYSSGEGVQFRTGSNTSNLVYGCTGHNVGVGIRLPNAAENGIHGYINNHITECGEYINNNYSGTANKWVIEINTRTKNNTTGRTGIGDGIEVGEITTDTGGDETDFVDTSSDNFRLISAAPGKAAAMVAYDDCGAYQRQEAGGGGGGLLVHPGTSGGARG